MTAEDKLSFRRQMLDLRAEFSNQQVKQASEAIAKRVKNVDIWQQKQVVHIYLPIEGEKHEISTWPIVEFLLAGDHEVWTSYLPEDRDQDGHCRITQDTVYAKGRYDIPLPQETVVLDIKPSVIIVPCLAADHDGDRIGYGSGWYDWFLEQYPKALRIGLVYEELLFDEIPTQTKDERLDILVSQKRTIKLEKRR